MQGLKEEVVEGVGGWWVIAPQRTHRGLGTVMPSVHQWGRSAPLWCGCSPLDCCPHTPSGPCLPWRCRRARGPCQVWRDIICRQRWCGCSLLDCYPHTPSGPCLPWHCRARGPCQVWRDIICRDISGKKKSIAKCYTNNPAIQQKKNNNYRLLNKTKDGGTLKCVCVGGSERVYILVYLWYLCVCVCVYVHPSVFVICVSVQYRQVQT